MAVYKNFSQKSRKKLDGSYDDFNSPHSHDPKKSKDINIEEWIKFTSYYRYYIDEFAINILGFDITPTQRVILRCMGRYDSSMFIASRGIGKSYLSALYFICVAILYPGIKLGIASGKGNKQFNVSFILILNYAPYVEKSA
jgi:hypothetical protein